MLIYPLRKLWISADTESHGYNAYDWGWFDADPSMPEDSGRNPRLYAMADGIVIGIVNSHSDEPDMNGYGNTITIRYPSEGYVSLYAHIKKDSFLVKVGDKVTQGQPVCRMGNSGYSFGNHLHMEVCKGSSFVRHGGVDYVKQKLVYATTWHYVDPDTQSDYGIAHMVIEPSDRDVTVNQVHVTGKDLRIRKSPINGDVVGFAPVGYYTYTETKEDEYTWCKVGNYWIAGNTDVSELCPASFLPTERDTSVPQCEVTIDDLRIRIEPSTSSTILGYAPKGYYTIEDSVSESDYVWFKVNGSYIACVDGVNYLAPQGDPEVEKLRKENAELKEKILLLEDEIYESNNAYDNLKKEDIKKDEALESIRQICDNIL